MGVFQVVFFAIIAFVLFFSLFFKSKEEFLTRYLVYFMVMSFFFHFNLSVQVSRVDGSIFVLCSRDHTLFGFLTH